MRTMCDLFLTRKPQILTAVTTNSTPKIRLLCDGIGHEYLDQDGCEYYDKEISPTIIQLACLSLEACAAAIPRSLNSSPTPETPEPNNDKLSSILISVIIDLLRRRGLLKQGGWLARYRRVEAEKNEQERAASAQNQFFDSCFASLENFFRCGDDLLFHLRETSTMEEKQNLGPLLRATHLKFIQDLAEAGVTEDSAFALALARRRLPAVVQDLGIQLVDFREELDGIFDIDSEQSGDRDKGIQTVRPALMSGNQCILRGYARRFV